MSGRHVAVIGMVGMMLLGMAGACLAQDYGGNENGVVYGAMRDPYAGVTPTGMRFGDQPQVVGAEGYGNYGGFAFGAGPCDNCGTGQGPGNCCLNCGPKICDPCWCGPCMDWKQIGWYSCWKDCHEKNHCCRRACCKKCCCDPCF